MTDEEMAKWDKEIAENKIKNQIKQYQKAQKKKENALRKQKCKRYEKSTKDKKVKIKRQNCQMFDKSAQKEKSSS